MTAAYLLGVGKHASEDPGTIRQQDLLKHQEQLEAAGVFIAQVSGNLNVDALIKALLAAE